MGNWYRIDYPLIKKRHEIKVERPTTHEVGNYQGKFSKQILRSYPSAESGGWSKIDFFFIVMRKVSIKHAINAYYHWIYINICVNHNKILILFKQKKIIAQIIFSF